MKADIVVCYYRKPTLWPMVAHGLALNKDHIGTVYVCNDESWDNVVMQQMQTTINGRFDYQFLWHEHDSFGAAKSINQGAKQVKTEYFIHIDDDIVLREDCVAKLLEDATETTLLAGLCDDLQFQFEDDRLLLEPQPVLREDRRKWFAASIKERYLDVRDCLLCCNTKTYRDLGGKDEAYNGYGFIDYDFGIRWMMKHGLDSFQMGRGLAWNIGGLNKPHPWSESNKVRFDVQNKLWLDWLGKSA